MVPSEEFTTFLFMVASMGGGENLNVGDYVDFRAIRPVATAIRKGS